MHSLRNRLRGCMFARGRHTRVLKALQTPISLCESVGKKTFPIRSFSTEEKIVSTAVMEGHTLADNILDDVFARSVYMTEVLGRAPKLAVVLVGGRDDSLRYIQVKQRAAKAVGIDSVVEQLDENIDMYTLQTTLHKLNSDSNIDGIIIQQPLPPHLIDSVALQSVVPHKDVDGFHLNNQAHLLDAEQCSKVIYPLVGEHVGGAPSNDSQGDIDASDMEVSAVVADASAAAAAATSKKNSQIVKSQLQSLNQQEQSTTLDSIEQQRPNWLPALEPSFFSSIWSYLSFSTLNFRVDLQQVTKTMLPFKDEPHQLPGTTTAETKIKPAIPAQFTSPLLPCTPLSCLALLDQYQVPLRGSHVVVLGRSTVVGFPLSLMLMHRGAIVTNVDRNASPEQRRQLCSQADIIVSAVGIAGIVDKDCVKPGAVVLDVGINFVKGGKKSSASQYAIPERRWQKLKSTQTGKGPGGSKLVGDADFDSLVDHAGMITPVPGGVGPVTVAMLLRNTVTACEYNNRHVVRVRKM